MVKEATKTGYSTAEPGDSINLAFPNSETRRGRVGKGCAHTLQAGQPEQVVVEPSICAMRGRNPDNPSDRTRGILLEQRLEMGGGMANTLTSVQKDNLVAEPTAYDEQNGYLRKDGTVGALTTDGSSPKHNNRIVETSFRIRKLTPRECFRLMDFDDADFVKAKYKLINDNETAQWFLEQEKKVHARTMKREEWKKFYVYLRKKHERVSDSQLYKQAGNSIVVAVLEAIFREML